MSHLYKFVSLTLLTALLFLGGFHLYGFSLKNTNQPNITLNAITEQLADVEYFLIDNTGQNIQSENKTFINNRDQKHQVSFNLGDKTADRDGNEPCLFPQSVSYILL